MKIIERNHNVITGKIVDVERDATPAEIKAAEETEAIVAKNKAQAEAKAALLERLGITEEEAKLLLS